MMARIDFVTGNALLYLPEVEAIAGVPDRLEDALRGKSAGDLRKAGPDGRTGARVLGDVIAYAEADHVALHRMAWMSDPVIRTPDLEQIAEAERWDAQSPGELIARLTRAVAETVELLKDQPDASWGRPGLFPERRSLRQQVRHSIAHYAAETEALQGALNAPRA